MRSLIRFSCLIAIFLFFIQGVLPVVFPDSFLADRAEAAQCSFAGAKDDSNPCDAGLSKAVKTKLGENAVTSCSAVNYKPGASPANITGSIEVGFCPTPSPVTALVFPTVPSFPSVGKDKDKDKDKEEGGPASCPADWPVFDLATHTDANGFLTGTGPFQFCSITLTGSQTLKTSDGDIVWVADKLDMKNNSVLQINGKTLIQVADEVKLANSSSIQVNGWWTLWTNKKFKMDHTSLLVISGDATINAKSKVEIKKSAEIQVLNGSLTVHTDDKLELKDSAKINATNGRSAQVLILAKKSATIQSSAYLAGAVISNDSVKVKNSAQVFGSVLASKVEVEGSATIVFGSGAGSDTKGFGCAVFTGADPGGAADIDSNGFSFDQSLCTITVPCVGTSLDRLKIIYHREFLPTFAACDATLPTFAACAANIRNAPQGTGATGIDVTQGVTGTNMKVSPMGSGVTSCTVSVDKRNGGTDCGYRIFTGLAGKMLKIDTKPRNGALNCLMKFSVQVPNWFHIEEDPDDTETEEAVMNENSLVDDPLAGFVGNRGHATILGMTGRVKTRSTSGNVFADLTSDNVRMKSLTGDLWGQGLTQKGYFRSWGGGSVRVRYCKNPQDTPGKNLTLFVRPGTLSVGVGDTTISFPTSPSVQVFESLVSVQDPTNKLKNMLGDCGTMCAFKVQGKTDGHLFINSNSESCKFTPTGP